jgi:hypothetical protein
VLSLDGCSGELGLDGGQLSSEGRAALCCLARLGRGPLVHLGRLAKRCARLLRGERERLQRSLGRRPAPLGILGRLT